MGSNQFLVDDLKREVILHPENPEIRYQLAEALFGDGQFAAAAKQALRVIEGTPTGYDNSNARRLYVRALDRDGRRPEALKMLEEHLKREPDDVGTRDELIELMVEQGRIDDALLHAEAALKLRPDDVTRHLLIADWSRIKGLMPRARAALETAQRLSPEDAKIASQLRELYLDLGDEAAAERMAGTRDRGYFLRQTQKALSLDAVRKLVAVPELQAVTTVLERGDVASARRNLSNVTASAKELPGYWLLRAEIQLIDGDTEAAEVSLKRTADMAPALGLVWNRLGDLAQGAGQFRDSIDLYKKAILLNPNDANAYEDLGDVLATLGDKPAAIKMYKAAIKRDGGSSAGAEAKLHSLEDPPKIVLDDSPKVGRIGVLGWTPHGGAVSPLEAVAIIGHGNLIFSGNVGPVGKEAGQVAFSCLKARAKELGVDQLVGSYDLHLHYTDTEVGKEGASAGLALVLAGISAYQQKPLRARLAATGEITIYGEIKPVGGIHEKIVSAMHNGIRTVLLPKRNLREARDLPEEVRSRVELIYVDTVAEAVPRAFEIASPGDFK